MATVTMPTTTSKSARRRLSETTPALLARAAHPRQALLTTLVFAAAGSLAGLSRSETAWLALTVLVGQLLLGWHNDLVDATADRRHHRIKPTVDGLAPSTLSFWVICAVLAVVPIALSNGVTAGLLYLASLAIGVIGNLRRPLVRTGPLSWLPWAASFAIYPAFVAYVEHDSGAAGAAPQTALVALSALLGVGIHIFTSMWGLLADNADGWKTLPLWLARTFGATRVLLGSIVFLGFVAATMAIVGQQVGLAA